MSPITRYLSLLLALLGVQSISLGQSVTVGIGSGSGTAGSTVDLPITLTSSGGAQTAGLQWTFNYSSNITGVNVVAGPSATSAGKSVTCSGNSCLILGFNSTAMADGTVAIATFQIAANPSAQSIPVQIAAVVASTSAGNSIPASGSSGTISLPAPAVTLTALTCSLATIPAPGSTQCTVSLSGTALAGGFGVGLSSNNGNLSVPAAVTVPAGQTSASFTASALQVGGSEQAVITATAGSVVRTASETLSGSTTAQLSSVSCSPSTLGSNSSSSCTVSLSGPVSGTTPVSLSSNSSFLIVPGSVNVLSGQSTALFTAVSGNIGIPQSATVQASLNSVIQTTTVSLTSTIQVSALSCSPSSVVAPGSATCSVSLTAAASGSGATVSLASSNPNVTVPSSVNVSANQSSASFTATVAAVTSNQTSLLTATLNGGAQQFTLNVNGSGINQPNTLNCSPASVLGPGSSLCTVTLSTAATSQVTVNLSSSDSHVTVPATVAVSAGQTTASFAATATAVISNIQAQLTASFNGASQQFVLGVTAPSQTSQLSSLVCLSPALGSGDSTQCTVSLTGATGSPASVGLSSNRSNLMVPPAVIIPAGSSSAAFTATAQTVTFSDNAVLMATLGTTSQATGLNLVSPHGFKSLTCIPSVLDSNSTATCNLQLWQPAQNPIRVTLSTSDVAATVPATTAIFSQETSVSFQVQAGIVTKPKAISVLAEASDESISGSIQILQGLAPVLNAPARLHAALNNLLTFTVSASDSTQSSPVLSASSLPPGAVFDPKGAFSWTPAQTGSYAVTITATSPTTGLATSSFVVITVDLAKAQITGLYNSANLTTGNVCSPGAIATLTGFGFTGQLPQTAIGPDWPTELAGTQVKVDGKLMPLYFASDTAINFQCPALPSGSRISIALKPASLDAPDDWITTMQEATPGIFLIDGIQGAVMIAGTNQLAMPVTDNIPSRPARQGETISIYANGLGQFQSSSTVTAVIGDSQVELTPLFAGLISIGSGLSVVNVKLPLDIQTGSSVPVYLKVVLSDRTVAKSNIARFAIAESVPQ